MKRLAAPGALLKSYLPASLFGRALLILVVPMIIMQTSAIYFFYAHHWENVQRHLSLWLAGDVAYLVQEVTHATDEEAGEVAFKANALMGMTIVKEPAPAEGERFTSGSRDPVLRVFAGQLSQRIVEPFSVYRTKDGEFLVTSVHLRDGGVLRLRCTFKRLANVTAEIFIWWMLGSALLLLLIATVFLRNQIRPIHKLADAAEQFGRGLESEDFRPQGASEVRQAGRSFLAMRERIKRIISARTEMLAGISHDLRTPLTRMRLTLAMLPPQAQEKAAPMLADVKEMEKMIQEYLDFARGEGGEKPREVELAGFLEEMVRGYAQQGAQVSLAEAPQVQLRLMVNAMRRCLANVIENALRYGSRCELRAASIGRRVELILDDDGPGIPSESRDLALQPFKRLDPSRNLDTGGAGLGLSIVQDIVLRHGGELALEDSPLGGLRVRIRLPL